MSLSSTSSAAGQRAVRAATALVVAVALLMPAAVLFAQVWSSTRDSLSFVSAERRGVAYLGPLTRLLSVSTEAQSAAVRGQAADTAEVRAAIAAVDDIDRRLGAELRTTERWLTIRATVQERTVREWPNSSVAYTQYSDLVTSVMELNRKVGDASKLILDPELDTYYVMNAALLRIPEILVDSGRYADLSVLAATGGPPDSDTLAQLTTARNRVATNANDLTDGLEKAFADTRSPTLGPGLTRPLDDFRTAVDAVAPSSSLLAPAPERSLSDLATYQDALQRAALALQEAALTELDLLLSDRAGNARRTRLIAGIAVTLAVLLAAAAAVVAVRLVWPGPDQLRPAEREESEPTAARPAGETHAEAREAGRPSETGRRPAPPRAASPGADPAPGLVGALGPEQRGGARAAR